MNPDSGNHRFGGIGHAFADRNFCIYSVGSFASWVSFFVQIIAVAWLTWELTHSTVWLATMALLDIVPNLILLPIGGAMADRFDRFRLMATAHFLLLIQATVMAVLAWLGMLTILPLAILVLIHGVLLSFSVPAMFGMLPRFVEKSRLSSAISVNAAYTQVAYFVGPALAGLVISGHGIALAFVINAMGYAIQLGSMLFLKTPSDFEAPAKRSATMFGDIIDGTRYIRGHRGILALLVILLAGDALGRGFINLLPAYSDQILGMGIVGVSAIMVARGIGATVAALWLAYGGASAATAERVLWAFLLYVVAVAVLVLFGYFYVAFASALVIGVAGEVRRTGTLSLVQLTVEEDQRGRVMGNMFLLSQLGTAVGTYVIGTAAVSQGLVAPMLIATFVCFGVWLFYFIRRRSFVRYFDVA